MKTKYINIKPVFLLFLCLACKKSNTSNAQTTPPPNFSISQTLIDNNSPSVGITYSVSALPVISFLFTAPVNRQLVATNIVLKELVTSNSIPCTIGYGKGDSIVTIQPQAKLNYLAKYTTTVSSKLLSAAGGNLTAGSDCTFVTKIDSTNKFPAISDTALLTLIQKQTFKYFWDFGHPVCGMALERNNGDNNVVTTGGTGFGIMAMIVATDRGFIARADAVARLTTIVNFLTNHCQRWHGAFSHWINGNTGLTVPFGNNNGADIVETSYLMQGLLTARQYFNTTSGNEKSLRDSINSIWNKIEWNWFTQNGTQKGIYWQYNPSFSNLSDIWSIPVTGWNEALITYVLGASSTSYPITKYVYDIGWAKNGSIKNGSSYFGISLPLGESYGGPLFFEHYSFLGINPNGLTDGYANYQTQTTAHSLINFNYCVNNPKYYFGYSSTCWGLTASDISGGYTASSPTNDGGNIAPTAAISSLPYTPIQSMNAIKYFYYTIGDKIWKDYGFVDAFNLTSLWYADSYLAIDQGPIIVMIENYRTGLLWNLFTSCPEVKAGMKNLGFSAPYL